MFVPEIKDTVCRYTCSVSEVLIDYALCISPGLFNCQSLRYEVMQECFMLCSRLVSIHICVLLIADIDSTF